VAHLQIPHRSLTPTSSNAVLDSLFTFNCSLSLKNAPHACCAGHITTSQTIHGHDRISGGCQAQFTAEHSRGHWQAGPQRIGAHLAILLTTRHRFVPNFFFGPCLAQGTNSTAIISERSVELTSYIFSQGATARFVTGRASKRPDACPSSDPSFDGEGQMPAFPSPSPSPHSDGPLDDHRRHLSSHIECCPSATNIRSPAAEQLSGAEPQVTVANPQPFFVPSTASASEVLTNVAIQDWFATGEDADFYELPFQHHPTSSSSLASVSDWDSLEFVNLSWEDSDDVYDSDFDLENVEEEAANEPSSWSSAEPPATNSRRALAPASLPSSVQINEAISFFSSSVVEVTFGNTRSVFLHGEDDDDGEEAIIVPIASSFLRPYRLSTIFEEDEEVVEDSPGPKIGYEDSDDASSAEPFGPSSTLAHLGPANDAGSDGRLPVDCANHGDLACE
jgi:hypothetical protein